MKIAEKAPHSAPLNCAVLPYLLTILPDRCARDNDPAVDDLMPWQDQVRKACGVEC